MGLDGETDPDTGIEDMAARYIREIQTVQKQGPYVLGGHSFGADVALEMSKLLQDKGQQVARLCIFDSTIPLNQPLGLDWDEAQWITDVARIAERLLGKAPALSLADFRQLDSSAQLNRLHEALEANGWAISEQQLSGLIRTFKANCQASYVPQAIPPVPIALFIAADTLTETASGIELERLRALLKQQADLGLAPICGRPGGHSCGARRSPYHDEWASGPGIGGKVEHVFESKLARASGRARIRATE